MKCLKSVGQSLMVIGLYSLTMLTLGYELTIPPGIAMLVMGIILMVIGIMGGE